MEISQLSLCSTGITIPLITVVICLIWYIIYIPNYWKSQGIPHVKPLPLFGTVLDTVRKPLHEIELERYKKYGKVYGHYEGKQLGLSIGDPNILRKICIKDFEYFTDRWSFWTGQPYVDDMVQFLHGDEWKRVRTIITPGFTTLKLKKMMEKIKFCVKDFVTHFNTLVETGKTIDLKKFYSSFVMDVITSAIYSIKVQQDKHESKRNEFVQNAKDLVEHDVNWRFFFYLLFPEVYKIFKISVFDTRFLHFFIKVSYQLIEERKARKEKGNDLLQQLIDADEEFAESWHVLDEELKGLEHEHKGAFKKKLSSKEVVAQSIFFFVAGFETTANALAFTTYHLALHPNIQEKLIKELDDAITQCKGQIPYEMLQDLKYLDNVIHESLRITPPASRMDRVVVKDYNLDGVIIPKGTIITVPVIGIHMDEEYYTNPEKFDPDRFTPEEKAKRDPLTFLTFGAGPRNCIGSKMALIEIKMCLAYVFSHFRVKQCQETKVPLDYFIGLQFLQPKDVTVRFEKRNDSPLTE